MDIKEKIAIIEDIMEVDEGSLAEDTVLNDLDEWDSITRLSLLIYYEEEQGKKLTGDEIRAFTTVKDLIDLID
ncbi:MAG: acyl carrier protein [Bacillota bacterium]